MGLDITFDENQTMLQRAARGFFASRCPLTAVRELESGDGFSGGLWREMSELGWLGISLPEEHGGAGGTMIDLYPLYEELGRSLAPVPHLDTVVVAGGLISAIGTDEQRARILPAIAGGSHIVSVAVLEPGGGHGPEGIGVSARRRADAFVLDGVKVLVPFASVASSLLCVVRTDGEHGLNGISLLVVDASSPGLTVSPLTNLAGLPLHAVTFDGVEVPVTNILGQVDAGWFPFADTMLRAAVLQAAAIVGSARAVLEMTNQYAKDRHQFGQPIGRYQAVQYLVSDILLDLHRIELLAVQATVRISTGRTYEREAAIAAAYAKRASAHLHRQAHEVHAGIGMMAEHDLNLFSRRAKFLETHMGDARHYEHRLAQTLGIVEPE